VAGRVNVEGGVHEVDKAVDKLHGFAPELGEIVGAEGKGFLDGADERQSVIVDELLKAGVVPQHYQHGQLVLDDSSQLLGTELALWFEEVAFEVCDDVAALLHDQRLMLSKQGFGTDLLDNRNEEDEEVDSELTEEFDDGVVLLVYQEEPADHAVFSEDESAAGDGQERKEGRAAEGVRAGEEGVVHEQQQLPDALDTGLGRGTSTQSVIDPGSPGLTAGTIAVAETRPGAAVCSCRT
jgi:hypothetical protein